MADTAALNRILRIAHLLEEFYGRALAGTTLLPAGSAGRASVELIRAHQTGHVAQLVALGATLQRPPASAYNFTAGGAGGRVGGFAAVFTQAAEMLRVAQLLEDLAVRAVKGELVSFRGDAALGVLLRMHATHGRHAAQVRRLRARLGGAPTVKPWITEATPGPGYSAQAPAGGAESQAAVAARVYGPAAATPGASAGEDNRVQDRVTLPAGAQFTEAYDEPMTAAQADAVLALFQP